jgi:nitrogen fixation protein FixH
MTRKVTGRTVLVCLVAFFAVVTGVNAIMIRAAVSTFGGVETKSAYEAGLAMPREIAAVEAQDALRWQVNATVSSEPRATLIKVTATDAAGRPLTGMEATASLQHPTDARADHVVSLEREAPGTFAGHTERLSGQWVLVIELVRDGKRLFRSNNRVFLH